MLGSSNVYATIAVKDMAIAKKFYGETLGLAIGDENPAGVTYKSGQSKIFVYQSQYAGTNQATCAAWDADDVSKVVDELKNKGVSFEHYDLPDVKVEGDIHIWGEHKSAWFKDPDGNILSVNSM